MFCKIRSKRFVVLLSAAFLFLIVLGYLKNQLNSSDSTQPWISTNTITKVDVTTVKEEIVIAVVSCGMRQQETLNMLKSIIIFGYKSRLRFIVITEDHLMNGFREKLADWANSSNVPFRYDIKPILFPTDNEAEWRNLFKPCASQRLFLPDILPDIDSVVYLDTDTLFISPVENVWRFFHRFNASQLAALTPEHEDPNVGWYNRFSKHPYFGKLGVNSGVMLMNLTRMREFNWNSYMLPLYREYKLKITWGDQDLINILFYYYPDKLYVMPCEFNYRPDHCIYMSVCDAPNGIQILHGNRGYFHSEKQPIFSTIYRLIEAYQFGSDLATNLLMPLETALNSDYIRNTNCGKLFERFLKQPIKMFSEHLPFYSYKER